MTETTYKIHPAIGVARIGNSDEYYLAPISPGGLPVNPSTKQPYTSADSNVFRDADNKLKKQAAQFKIFAYDDQSPNGREVVIGSGDVASVDWTVYLANKKAVWYQFRSLVGSGQKGDKGYMHNNKRNPNISTMNGPNDYYNYVPTYTKLEEKEKPHEPYKPYREYNAKRLSNYYKNSERQKLIIDPGPLTLSGANSSAEFTLGKAQNSYPQTFPPDTLRPQTITSLGKIQTDGAGNLLVLGANGNSGTTADSLELSNGVDQANYANNTGWFDDIADGPVEAKVNLKDGTSVEINAWVMTAPPAYAPEVINQVNLHDTMYDIGVRELNAYPNLYSNGAFNPDYMVDVANEIVPILERPQFYAFVANIFGKGPVQHSNIGAEADEPDYNNSFPFYILRDPSNLNDSPGLMPYLAGDNPIYNQTMSKYLSLTETQYFLLKQWNAGKINATTQPPVLGPGQLLDKANLENCVGGAFNPGIEITWVSRNKTIYNAPFEFRINAKPLSKLIPGKLGMSNGEDHDYSDGLEPGDLSKYMAQPWQADFNECSVQNISSSENNSPRVNPVNYWWWPAQRPWSVFPQHGNGEQLYWTRFSDQNNTAWSDDLQMVANWKDLGFIINTGSETKPKLVEIQRNPNAIEAFNSFQPGNIISLKSDNGALCGTKSSGVAGQLYADPGIDPNSEKFAVSVVDGNIALQSVKTNNSFWTELTNNLILKAMPASTDTQYNAPESASLFSLAVLSSGEITLQSVNNNFCSRDTAGNMIVSTASSATTQQANFKVNLIDPSHNPGLALQNGNKVAFQNGQGQYYCLSGENIVPNTSSLNPSCQFTIYSNIAVDGNQVYAFMASNGLYLKSNGVGMPLTANSQNAEGAALFLLTIRSDGYFSMTQPASNPADPFIDYSLFWTSATSTDSGALTAVLLKASSDAPFSFYITQL